MTHQDPSTLTSFDAPIKAVVIGASGGIGQAFVEQLDRCSNVQHILACSRSPAPTVCLKAQICPVDLEDEMTIEAAAEQASKTLGELDLILVATGLLHDGDELGPEKTWRHLNPAALDRIFRINTIGPGLIAKHFLPHLARGRKTVFAALSARVGSITDNHLGGWYGYRASKAALNMLIRTLSIELARRCPKATCVGLHPGTVATDLSSPFRANLPAKQLFTPDQAVRHLLHVIDGLKPTDSGKLIAWDGQIIPY